MKETAQRAALVTLVAAGSSCSRSPLWQLKLLVALLFFAFILAAAMRPRVEALARRGIPRGVGIALHYVVFIGLIAGFLWLVVPRRSTRSTTRSAAIPTTRSDLGEQARHSTGIKHEILVGLQQRLDDLPTALGARRSRPSR